MNPQRAGRRSRRNDLDLNGPAAAGSAPVADRRKPRRLIKDDLVAVLLADTLTKGERTLVDNGRRERVIQLRHDYQLVMRDDLIAIVERQLEPKVIAFMSNNHIDPDLAVEMFVLEPAETALAKRLSPSSSHERAALHQPDQRTERDRV